MSKRCFCSLARVWVVAGSALSSFAVAALELVAPAQNATVPLLNAQQKAFMQMPREARAAYFDDAQKEREAEIKTWGDRPLPVDLRWRGAVGEATVTVTKKGASRPFFTGRSSGGGLSVWNLEVAAEYDWCVTAGGETAQGSFRTEDLAPRLIYIGGDKARNLRGVPNMRDMGGRVMPDGRRVRQGLVFRSAGLNNNANTVFYKKRELLALEKEGRLEKMADPKAQRLSRQLKKNDKIDWSFTRIIKQMPTRPGTPRLSEEWRSYLVDTLGIRTDIDLRSDREICGMSTSPLGPGVRYVHAWENYNGYGSCQTTGLEATKHIFRLFMDRANYPIDFHCIGGADRTGTIASLLHGVLGADDEAIWRDYQITAWCGGVNDARHYGWFKSFVKSFDAYRGATLSARICDFFKTKAGFSEADLDKIRDILLEPAAASGTASAPAKAVDLVVYGGTSAGIAAAVQARRMGLAAVLIEPSQRLGGLTTGGLGRTDIGNKQAIGGIAREFYRAIKAYYRDPAHWTRETPDEYAAKLGRAHADLFAADAMWTFEPSAANAVLEGWVARDALDVVRGERLDRGPGGVTCVDGRIAAIRMESGRVFAAKMFVDATYEGDLMAAAGVSYTVGREPNSQYGESISGIQRALSVNHQFVPGVDPYVVKGDPTSGLLPFVERDVDLPDGAGDGRVQAYCFRMCLTDDPDNRIPFAKPEGYDPRDYELLLRNFEAGEGSAQYDPTGRGPWINSPMPNRKTDTNNRTGFSTDFIGGADRWPEASYAEREEIARRHLRYQQGVMWTLANSPRVPEKLRGEIARWGTCRDEFAGERGAGWQNQLYVREARRLVGEYVMTEHNCRGGAVAARAVGLGAYGMDSHHIRRYLTKDGFVRNEGNIEDYSIHPPAAKKKRQRFSPYPIDYGAIIPKRGQCANLLVPVCVSASHMAFGSIRMEPVFFVLGQSAATAAALAIQAKAAVQDVDYAALKARLLADGQVLDWDPNRRFD